MVAGCPGAKHMMLPLLEIMKCVTSEGDVYKLFFGGGSSNGLQKTAPDNKKHQMKLKNREPLTKGYTCGGLAT